MAPDISVVVPLRDEERNVLPLHEQITAAMAPLDIPYELILVDDGGRDETFARLRDACARDPEAGAGDTGTCRRSRVSSGGG